MNAASVNESAAPANAGTPRPAPAVARIAAQFGREAKPPLPTRIAASLRRMNPADPSPALAALIPVLMHAEADFRDDERLRRWAVIVHVVAIFAGTQGRRVYASGQHANAGSVLHDADFKELRFMRLLTARGPALGDQVVRLARFLAAKEAMPIDLRPLANLILFDGIDETKAEAARLELARGYYGARAKADAAAQNPDLTTDTSR